MRIDNDSKSDRLLEEKLVESGLVPIVDLDGATWWVKPEDAAGIKVHSVAKMRSLPPNPNAGKVGGE